MALDQKDIEQVKGLIAESTKPLTEQFAAMKTAVDAMPAALTESVTKGLAEPLNKLVTDAVAKIAPAPKADDKDKGKKTDDAEPPAWAKALSEDLKALKTGVDPVIESHKQTTQRSKSQALVESTLKELKLGGLLKNQAVMERLVGANPADAAAVKKLVEGERAYAVSLGIKAESFGADPAAEGGKPGEEQTSEKKFIEDIRNRKPTRL